MPHTSAVHPPAPGCNTPVLSTATPLKLIEPLPRRRSARTSAAPRKSFRRRYDELEARRAELIARLATLGERARQHPAYKRSLTLLNDNFRKGKLAQRLAVLEAAAFLIDVLEMLTGAA